MKKEWEAKHPGYCGLCGLPFNVCIHQNADYMKEVKAFVSANDVTNAIKLKAKWYTEVITKMTPQQVRALPKPPREWMDEIRSLFARSKTAWDHLVEDDVL